MPDSLAKIRAVETDIVGHKIAGGDISFANVFCNGSTDEGKDLGRREGDVHGGWRKLEAACLRFTQILQRIHLVFSRLA